MLTGAAALLAGVLLLWTYLRHVGALPGESWLYDAGQRHRSATTNRLTNFWGDLATAPVAGLTVAIAATVVGRNVGPRAALLVLVASAAVLGNAALRAALGPTPLSARSFGTESYPSGHVVYATTVFGALGWLGWQHGRREATVILVGLAAVMGPARVLAASHLPSDVVAGYAFGGAWLLAALAVLRPDVSTRARGGPPRPSRRSSPRS